MNFKSYFLMREGFKTIDRVLSNPAYKDKSFYDILEDFRDDGGEMFTGRFGKVLVHPKWKYVIKLFVNDICYLRFIRTAWKNQNISGFPKMFDKPRRIVPGFKRHIDDELVYVVRMEKLNPLKMERWEFEKIRNTIYASPLHYMVLGMVDITVPWFEELNPQQRAGYEQNAREFLEQNKTLKPLFDAYNLLHHEEKGCNDDLTMQNIMMRDNGELVLTDPLWFDELASPYARHDAAVRAEIGDYPDDYDVGPPPTVRGGERYKKPRVRKKKPMVPAVRPPVGDDDVIPF